MGHFLNAAGDHNQVTTHQVTLLRLLSNPLQLVNTPGRNRLVVDSYLELAAGRRAIAFCCSIQHAEDLAEAFR